MKLNNTKQQGVALISVLFITALVVAIITAISHRQTLDIQQTGNLVFRSQAFQYLKAAETLVSEMLFQDYDLAKQNNDPVKDTPEDYWVSQRLVLPIPNSTAGFEAELFDLQGKFNLNSLVDTDGQILTDKLEQLKRLFNGIATSQSMTIPSSISESIADWVDTDDSSTGLGSEEGDYLIQTPSYRTNNSLFSSVDELLLIKDINRQNFSIDQLEFLKSEVAVLPDNTTAININLASKEVILSLHPELQSSEVDSLIEDRKAQDGGGYDDVNDFLAHQAFAGLNNPPEPSTLTISTSYFLLKTRVTMDDRVVQAFSVLYRDPEDGKTIVISRDLSKRYIADTSKPIFKF